MGFINYNGKKEDRYDEIVEYSHALQEEEWRKTQQERIHLWLEGLIGDGRLAHLNVQEMLKLVIAQYKAFSNDYNKLISKGKLPEKCDPQRLLKDLCIDLAARHIQAYHTSIEIRDKHLQAFIERIYKLEDTVSAQDHFQNITNRTDYRKYFTECFDPTWTGHQWFSLLQYIGRRNARIVDTVFEDYKKLALYMNLYLYQAFKPRDYGWVHQIEAERGAIDEIKQQLRRHDYVSLKLGLLLNPLYYTPEPDTEEVYNLNEEASSEIKSDKIVVSKFGDNKHESKSAEIAGEAQPAETYRPKLDKDRFKTLINAKGIPNYVNACKMLLECELPEEIEDNYRMLVERMPILQDAIDRFDEVYHIDMDMFDEYFAPEALSVTATYLDYEAVSPSESILSSIRENVLQASKKLLLVVNEKIDEIYRFVTIETNAEARALEAIASQYGYVDSEFRM